MLDCLTSGFEFQIIEIYRITIISPGNAVIAIGANSANALARL